MRQNLRDDLEEETKKMLHRGEIFYHLLCLLLRYSGLKSASVSKCMCEVCVRACVYVCERLSCQTNSYQKDFNMWKISMLVVNFVAFMDEIKGYRF